MLRQRTLMNDRVLFRILKTKGTTASNLCEKLKQNVKNVTLLSEDELCELWQFVKVILVEAQKLYTDTLNIKSRYIKEATTTAKLICTITAMAAETISKRTFIPNTLLEIVMILHSVVLPNISDAQVKDVISHFLENWWKLDMVWKEKVITNALRHLVECAKSSLQHVKRLYEVKSASLLLKSEEDIQTLLKLVQKKTVMSLEQGQMLILHLFTLGERYILGIHNNVKIMLENSGHNFIVGYANLYANAWLNAKQKMKKFIVQNCLQNLIFHCLRAYRDSIGRAKLGKNLLAFLSALHNNKNDAVKKMMLDQCKPLIWKHLKAPGSYIRCNAAEVLFISNPIQYTHFMKNRNNANIKKYFSAMTDLLKDCNYKVCSIAIDGVFKILQKHWSNIPDTVIHEWFNILVNITNTSKSSDIRIKVFIGLKQIIVNEESHVIMRNFLSKFGSSIYDVNTDVVEAFVKLVWHAQNFAGIPFWDIIPLAYILDSVETTKNIFLLRQLVKLVWSRIPLNDPKSCKSGQEIVHIGIHSVNAIRKLCFDSKYALTWNVTSKLIKSILSMIEREIEHLFISEELKQRCAKRAKISNYENQHDNVKAIKYLENKDCMKYQDVHILIDAIAMLLIANAKNAGHERFAEEERNILVTIANFLPEFLNYFKDTPVNESVIFLLSLIPPTIFQDENIITQKLLKELYDPEVPDDVLLTIVYVLLKWDKGETTLSVLIHLFLESVNSNVPENQENFNGIEVTSTKEKSLELSLRILKHLLHVEHQSVLMNKYHEKFVEFWEKLHLLKPLIEKNLECKRTLDDTLPEEIVINAFTEYMTMVPLLHKENVFDAWEHFSEILLWIKRTIVPCIPDIHTAKDFQVPIEILKNTFDITSMLLKQYKISPKLCCDIVLLYCSCLTASGGIVFMTYIFDTIMILLDYGNTEYENKGAHVLTTIIPNFLCAAMITLTRYDEDVIVAHTNDLKTLSRIIQKYFFVIESTFKKHEMHLSCITIMLNTAVSSITTEITCLLHATPFLKENILFVKFPYLANKILKILLSRKKYNELCLQVLTKTITSYTKIDMLSALLIIRKMFSSPIRTPPRRLKNITLAVKIYNETQSYSTPFDRFTDDATKVVVEAILQS